MSRARCEGPALPGSPPCLAMSTSPIPCSPTKAPSACALKCAVVGVGAAGNAVVERLMLERNSELLPISLQSDARLLSRSMAGEKILLGRETLRGVGTGGDPLLGLEAARHSLPEWRECLEGAELVMLCGGLGGGTAGGAMPLVAREARALGALVVAVVSMPFGFEGGRRRGQAQEALEQLQAHADALLIFDNDRMGELVLPKDGIHKAFAQADQLMAQSLRSLMALLSMDGLVKLGLDDIVAALRSAEEGRCLFGLGEARGQNRGADAVKRALKSPLMDQGRLLRQTQSLLVHVCGGESLTLAEVDAIMKLVGRHVPDETKLLFGVSVQAAMGDSVSVMLLSALGLRQLHEEEPVAAAAAQAGDGDNAPAAPAASAPSPRGKRAAAEPAASRPDPLDEVMGNLFAQSFGEPTTATQTVASLSVAAQAEPTLLDLLTAQMQPASPEPVPAAAPQASLEQIAAEPAPPSKPRRLTLEEFLAPDPQPGPKAALETTRNSPQEQAGVQDQEQAAHQDLDVQASPEVQSEPEPAPQPEAELEAEEGMQLPSWLRSARVLGRR